MGRLNPVVGPTGGPAPRAPDEGLAAAYLRRGDGGNTWVTGVDAADPVRGELLAFRPQESRFRTMTLKIPRPRPL